MRNRFLHFSLALLLWVLFAPARGQSTRTVGLIDAEPGALDGYTLLAPQRSDSTFLIDNCGRVVHSWGHEYEPGNSAYLLEDGRLLRTASEGQTANLNFVAGGASDRIRLWDWDGTLLWDWKFSNANYRLHHDVAWMPNGHVLAIAWERRGFAEAFLAGRDPAKLGASVVWPDIVVEYEPIFPDSARLVWTWRAWDHIIQDFDSTKDNFGVVADHPELIDLNYLGLQSPNDPDWIHCNSIAYHPGLDQIILSSREFCEFWIIDHSTTTAEAAGHSGGRYGKGGDLLYRWGNPEAYRAGASGDKQLFAQHDAHWIADSLVDGGKLMVFNNGTDRPGGNASSVDIIVPPQDSTGWYSAPAPGNAYGPSAAEWSYFAPVPGDLYSVFISNGQRLPNGNTLVNEGVFGHLFEVDPQDNVVWEYVCPVDDSGRIAQGNLPNAGPNGTLNNRTFRVYRYPKDYPGLSGRDLSPGGYLAIEPANFECVPLLEQTGTILAESYLRYSPNPARRHLQMEWSGPLSADYELLDLQGKSRHRGVLRPGGQTISLTQFAPGLYQIRVEGQVAGKIVVLR